MDPQVPKPGRHRAQFRSRLQRPAPRGLNRSPAAEHPQQAHTSDQRKFLVGRCRASLGATCLYSHDQLCGVGRSKGGVVIPTTSRSSTEPVAARNPARVTPRTGSAELVGVSSSTPNRPTPTTNLSSWLVGVRLLGPCSAPLTSSTRLNRSGWARGSNDWPETCSTERVGHEEPGSKEPTPMTDLSSWLVGVPEAWERSRGQVGVRKLGHIRSWALKLSIRSLSPVASFEPCSARRPPSM